MKVGSANWMRPLGSTGLQVSALCLGGSPLGSEPHNYGHHVTADAAIDLVTTALNSPVRMIDTSNGYSGGESERRIGAALTMAGGVPDGVLIVTKVDPRDGDFSATRVRASVEESCDRLGLDHLPLVYLHDPEFHDEATMMGTGGAVEGLVALREEGVIGHIGVAGGRTDVLHRYLDLGVFEVVLTHNRWTLVDRSAEQLFTRAQADGVGTVNAAVHGGGLLAAPNRGLTRYAYGPAKPAILHAVAQMAAACQRHNTDLATAALQFSLRTPTVNTTVVGMSSRQRLHTTLAACDARLPDSLWEELETLTPAPEHWLDHHLTQGTQ